MGIEEKYPKHEIGEDVTKYGEFVSTFFAWIPLEKQKEKAEKLARVTNKRKE